MASERTGLSLLLAGLSIISLYGCCALPGICDSGSAIDVNGQSSQKLTVAAVYNDDVIVADSGDVWQLGEAAGENCPSPLVQPGDELEVGSLDEQMLTVTGVFLAELRLGHTDCSTLGVWLGRAHRATVTKVEEGSSSRPRRVELSDGTATTLIDAKEEGWLPGDEVLIASDGSPGEWYIHLRTGRVYLFSMGR